MKKNFLVLAFVLLFHPFSSLFAQSLQRSVQKGDLMLPPDQFKNKPGILTGTEKADYTKCVEISTKGAQREMVFPSVLATVSPLLVGIFSGPFTVIAMLAGDRICSGNYDG